MDKTVKLIISEFDKVFTSHCMRTTELDSGASSKKIIRLYTKWNSYIGVYNNNILENNAFFSFTESFSGCQLNVPEIYHISAGKKIYIMNDLGRSTLYDFAITCKNRAKLFDFYSKAVRDLVKFQVYGNLFVDFSRCYETLFFGKEQLSVDFRKFSEYYLKKHNNTILKSNHKFIDLFWNKILKNSPVLFMYRDFQPRNIIVKKSKLSYVDYQSGRYGPPQYDLISFIYSGSINITDKERKNLTDIYFIELSKHVNLDKRYFYNTLKYFALLRIVQILGSYCYSFYENQKSAALSKIPNAINNLKKLDFKEDVFTELKNIILKSYS